MPIFGGTDANSSSTLFAKCGTTIFCIYRSAFLWLVVIAVFLLRALQNRLFPLARRSVPRGFVDKEP